MLSSGNSQRYQTTSDSNARNALPSVYAYRGLSISTVALVRFRVLLTWLIKRIKYRKAIVGVRRLVGIKGIHEGLPALVLGNGPSLQNLDISQVKEFQLQGGKIYVVNFYNENELAREIVPDYFVFADPVFISSGWQNNARVRETWSYIEKHGLTVFTAATTTHTNLPHNVIRYTFNDLSLQGWSRNTSPRRARGFIGITAYHAISISEYLGHNMIFTCGIDNTSFLYLELSPDGKVGLRPHHSYKENKAIHVLPDHASVGAFLEDTARCFQDLSLFDVNKLRNLDMATLIDAYPVGSLSTWLSESTDLA